MSKVKALLVHKEDLLVQVMSDTQPCVCQLGTVMHSYRVEALNHIEYEIIVV